jgi:hypothetical protein
MLNPSFSAFDPKRTSVTDDAGCITGRDIVAPTGSDIEGIPTFLQHSILRHGSERPSKGARLSRDIATRYGN